MAEREYIKLTRLRQRGGFAIISSSRSNLWLGKDHLLCVETEGYTESYKRFYFRDLQAITIRRTKRARYWTIVLSILALPFAIASIALFARQQSGDVPAGIFWSVAAVLFVVPLVINLVRGPTCACQLRTAVQTEDVPSLSRVRRARKVLNRIRPLIAEAQGQLAAGEIPLRFQELVTSPITSPASAGAAPPIIESPDAPPPITN